MRQQITNISVFFFIIPLLLGNSFIIPSNLDGEAVSDIPDTSYIEEVETATEPNTEVENKEEIPSILKHIAFCESGDKHFVNGEILRGKINPHDIGRYQINEIYHGEQAEKMGIDIYTEKGNEEFALWLYEKKGTQPWKWSKKCWSKYRNK